MAYVDGFVLPVPRRKLDAYRTMARKAGTIWKEFGAIEYRECVADDVKGKHGLPFKRCVRLKKGEVVLYSFIVYRTKAARDRCNRRVMKDPRIVKMMNAMVFDWKRTAFGGFRTIVDL